MKNADMPAMPGRVINNGESFVETLRPGAQAVSAGGGKLVERFNCTNGGAQFCQGCYTMTPDANGEYVLHEEYAKLEQQRAALVEALKQTWKVIDSAGLLNLSNGVQLGQTSWYGKARDARAESDAALKAAGERL